MKQQQLWKNPKSSHGGSHAVGKRKTARVIVTKSPMHVVLKSSRARGEWNFHRFGEEIEESAYKIAKRFRVRIRLYQNVGNHLHLVAQAASRREFQNFLRVLPQAIAFLVTKTRKGTPIGKFWDTLAFTRVIHWGRDWFGMKAYVFRNRVEAAGVPRDVIDRLYCEVRAAFSST